MNSYPIDLKAQVLSEYSRGECGYKKLAAKYGLKRDTVRGWILDHKPHMAVPMGNKKQDKDNVDELEFYKASSEYYKESFEYWKAYAEKLEEKRFGISQKKNKGRSNNRTSSDKEDSHS